MPEKFDLSEVVWTDDMGNAYKLPRSESAQKLVPIEEEGGDEEKMVKSEKLKEETGKDWKIVNWTIEDEMEGCSKWFNKSNAKKHFRNTNRKQCRFCNRKIQSYLLGKHLKKYHAGMEIVNVAKHKHCNGHPICSECKECYDD